MNLAEYRAAYNQSIGRQAALVKQKAEYEAAIDAGARRELAIEKAQVLIQQCAKETQSQLKFYVEDIVKAALDAVFPDIYDFSLEFEVKRNKTEARLIFTKNGFEVDPLNASGGGLVDVASLGLRMTAWSLSSSDNVLVLDEGLKFVSHDLQPRAAEILAELSEKLNLQVIMVTHLPDMIDSADRVFKVSQKKGQSKVET